MRIKMIVWQLVALALLAAAVYLQVVNFPFPSPLIRPLLEPRARWPEQQVKQWIDSGTPDRSFLEFFNRDPERQVPEGANLVAPADGVVKYISSQDGLTYFVVGLSFWDVHVVRSPVAGRVTSVTTEGYTFFRNSSETRDLVFLREKDAPVQSIVSLSTAWGEVKIRLVTSYWASRIKVWAEPGQRVGKGERIGRFLLGSSVVVELPSNPDFEVGEGERIVAGETIILDRSSR